MWPEDMTLSMSDAYAQIARETNRRHNHGGHRNTPRCKRCGGFTTKPRPENGQIKYTCDACGSAILEYIAQTQTATSD